MEKTEKFLTTAVISVTIKSIGIVCNTVLLYGVAVLYKWSVIKMATVLNIQPINSTTDCMVLFDEHNMVKVECEHGAYAIGDTVDQMLACSEIRYVSEVDSHTPDRIVTITAAKGHKIVGRIVDRKEGILQCGGFLFHMDPTHLHANMQEGCRFEWTCERMQLW